MRTLTLDRAAALEAERAAARGQDTADMRAGAAAIAIIEKPIRSA